MLHTLDWAVHGEFGSERRRIVALASVAGLMMACSASDRGMGDRPGFPIRWVAGARVFLFATGLCCSDLRAYGKCG